VWQPAKPPGGLSLLRELPPVVPARDEEVLAAVDGHRLWGKGIGWIDAHLLASACCRSARCGPTTAAFAPRPRN